MEEDAYREALERQGRGSNENTLAQTVGAGTYEYDGDASALERDAGNEEEVPTIIERLEGVRGEQQS
ncbi:MAG: hypothetical protein JO359_04435 [Candidatus Eremiobacteraeota bacterium]|nr:hypothetical protein [Candidatus Eremiobacteraeota bacterium]